MNQLLQECRHILERGTGLEAVIGKLRSHGLSKVHSMKALVDLGVADMAQAKLMIHDSPVWADLRARDEEFRAEFEKNLLSDTGAVEIGKEKQHDP